NCYVSNIYVIYITSTLRARPAGATRAWTVSPTLPAKDAPMNDRHLAVRALYGTPVMVIIALCLLARVPHANADRPTIAPQVAAPRALIPVEAVAAILQAFQTHPIVALGEGPHGNEQGHAFGLAL